jgi:predicted acylesterase/phospholipase RssA
MRARGAAIRHVSGKTALVLAGAVANGAFEAGVIQELAARRDDIPISRIVGASSGAINAAVYATAVRARDELAVADRLAQLWQHSATWHNALTFDWAAVLQRVGLGNGDRVLELMRATVADITTTVRQPVELRVVLTALDGKRGKIGALEATTFQHVARFRDEDFDTARLRDVIFEAALGSGAFPGVFAPVDVEGVGPCVDGGAINNTPIKQAISAGDVDRIIVVTAQPLVSAPARHSGLDLVSHFAEILIDERLYHDLRFAAEVNDQLARLDALAVNDAARELIEKVKQVLHWSRLDIVQIRPAEALPGGAFSGFSQPHLMQQYVQAGREAALRALAVL